MMTDAEIKALCDDLKDWAHHPTGRNPANAPCAEAAFALSSEHEARKAAESYAHELQVALTGLAGGGSENFTYKGGVPRADIRFCVSKINDRFSRQHDLVCDAIGDRKAAEARATAAEAEVGELRQKLASTLAGLDAEGKAHWAARDRLTAAEAEVKRLRGELIGAGPLLETAMNALIQARGALLLDAMVDDSGKPFGTTTVAIEAIDEAKQAIDDFDAALSPAPAGVTERDMLASVGIDTADMEPDGAEADWREQAIAAWDLVAHLQDQLTERMMTPAQIKYMVDRFLIWKLPADFRPDGGISFQKIGSPGVMFGGKSAEFAREPIGTNLLTATQAEAMVRHMLEGLPVAVAHKDTIAHQIEMAAARHVLNNVVVPDVAATEQSLPEPAPAGVTERVVPNPAGDWQPIATAPKTSTSDWIAKPILAWCSDPTASTGGDQKVIWWEPKIKGGCWYCEGEVVENPTLWKPLGPDPGVPVPKQSIPEPSTAGGETGAKRHAIRVEKISSGGFLLTSSEIAGLTIFGKSEEDCYQQLQDVLIDFILVERMMKRAALEKLKELGVDVTAFLDEVFREQPPPPSHAKGETQAMPGDGVGEVKS